MALRLDLEWRTTLLTLVLLPVLLTLAVADGSWRITGIELLEEKRVF